MGYDNYRGYAGIGDDQIENLNQAREDFYKDTQDLQDVLSQKRLELRSELYKQNPDLEKLKNIQNDISKLQADLDQKRIEHEFEMSKITPQAKRNFAGRGFSRGFGGQCWE